MFRILALLTLLTPVLAAQIPQNIQTMVEEGQWTEACAALEQSALEESNPTTAIELRFEAERLRRIALDFNETADQILARFQEIWPETTLENIDEWREAGHLQALVIDGEMRYFPRDVRHVTRQFPRPDTSLEATVDEVDQDYRNRWDMRVLRVLDGLGEDRGLVKPTRMRVTHRITVEPGIVPEGEMIRCWIPLAREEDRQTDIEVISTDPATHVVAPGDAPQRTVYMQRPASPDGAPTVFELVSEFTGWGFYQEIDPDSIQPYDTESEVFQTYTAEREPHIVFTPEIQELVGEIVGDETNPYLQAKRIFTWIDANLIWSGEREYSTIRCAPMLTLERGRGDCGMKAMTFITLCRAAGIPARWESGWHWAEGRTGMHDWARFYVEPHGWLWADADLGYRSRLDDPAAHDFLFGNVEPTRLVVNSDFAQPFFPDKAHFRSETLDSQRGEVEWDGGNLYFDQWDYDVEIEVLD